MNNVWLIQGLCVAAAGLAAMTLFLYLFVVCAVLYWHGARFPTGLMPWRYFRDLFDYKEIMAAKGKTTSLYYLMLFLTWMTVVVVLVLLVAAWNQRGNLRSLDLRLW